MSKYEVWAKDTYNRYEIVTVLSKKGKPENQWVTPQEAHEAARRFVHDKNRNNPLTYDEQKKNPNFALAEMVTDDNYYAGNLIQGRNKVIVASGDEEVLPKDAKMRFYMGEDPDNKPWYLSDFRKRPVETLDSTFVTDKTLVFIHKQK